MYKLQIKTLEEFKKQLKENNKILTSRATLLADPKVKKAIKANQKLIDLITNEYYID